MNMNAEPENNITGFNDDDGGISDAKMLQRNDADGISDA